MGDILNLRQARKRRDRVAKEQAAQENRIRFGRSKADKAENAAERRRQERSIDGARLDDGTPRERLDDGTPRERLGDGTPREH